MYKAGFIKIQSRPDLGFFHFADMPMYSSSNELRKACLYQQHRIEEMMEKKEAPQEIIQLLMKKLLKSTAILNNTDKREKYLHFLKIRSYIN